MFFLSITYRSYRLLKGSENQGNEKPSSILGARRRQAMCRVGDRIIVFGGTSPYFGPPIAFTPAQQQLLPDHDGSSRLIDHNDLYVLDLAPSLKTLSLLKVIENRLNVSELPGDLQRDFANMTTPNTISKKLKTLPLG